MTKKEKEYTYFCCCGAHSATHFDLGEYNMPVQEKAISDIRQFEALYDEYYDKVFVYIARRVRNSGNAEDLTADVFFKAFATPYDPRLASFSTYVFTIARNALKNYYRDTAKRQIQVSDETGFDLPGDTDLLDGLATQEEYAALQAALTELPERQYDIVYRRYYLEESFRDIGQAMGISENNARQIHFEALKKLRKYLLSP